MPFAINDSKFIKLLSNSEGPHSEERSSLKHNLFSARDKVGKIVQSIQYDTPGLTVHDITHLDNLWEIIDLLTPNSDYLNPAEIFVLGISILLHDAGHSLSSYDGGESEIQATDIWRDHLARAAKSSGLSLESLDFSSPPDEIRRTATFFTLRDLHAAHAENLAGKEWSLPDGSKEYLIQDSDLRTAYSEIAGKLAHSHHWDIEKIEELQPSFGAASSLPNTWTVNTLKIASIIRCADAAHLDANRAPAFTYTLVKPKGLSDLHWRFQNKLNKPTVNNGRLEYTSGRSFKPNEHEAWWLAYDSLNMVNNELSRTNDFLSSIGLEQLTASGVRGANTPKILSKYVLTEGWTPIESSIRVSSPSIVAQKLGGAGLYGNSSFVPIRELLQNSVDAVRAFRALHDLDRDYGKIKVTIIQSETSLDISFQDNGIGMSERVLTGPLIDFGSSFWATDLMHKEFPGLESKSKILIGQFGIGFFSVFMISNDIQVTSKRYDKGDQDINTLSLKSLNDRPILSKSNRPKLGIGFNTNIQLKCKSDFNVDDLIKLLKTAACTCEVGVEIVHNDDCHTISPYWENIEAETLLSTLYHGNYGAFAQASQHLTPIYDNKGEVVGRAALNISGGANEVLYSISGIASTRIRNRFDFPPHVVKRTKSTAIPPMIGVIPGKVENVARDLAVHTLNRSTIKNWLNSQYDYFSKEAIPLEHKAAAAAIMIDYEADSRDLPVAYGDNKLLTYNELVDLISSNGVIYFPCAYSKYDGDVDLFRLNTMKPNMVFDQLKSNILIGYIDRHTIYSSDLKIEELRHPGEEIDTSNFSADASLNSLIGDSHYLHSTLSKHWGAFRSQLKFVNIFKYNNGYSTLVLEISRISVED